MHWASPLIKNNVTVPSSRSGHSCCLVGRNLYLFGGGDSGEIFDELYIFNTETMWWFKPATFGDYPPPTKSHTADLVGNRIFLFGGTQDECSCDLYILNTETLNWLKPKTSGDVVPPRRAHSSFVIDNKLYIFGGGNGTNALNDMYVLDTNELTWSKVVCQGKIPDARAYHTTTAVDKKAVLIGGTNGKNCYADVYIFDTESCTWTEVKVDQGYPILGHSSCRIGGLIFCFGGHNGQKYTDQVASLNLGTMKWEVRATSGEPPTPRASSVVIFHDLRVFVFGGHDGQQFYNNLKVLDLSTSAFLSNAPFKLKDR